MERPERLSNNYSLALEATEFALILSLVKLRDIREQHFF